MPEFSSLEVQLDLVENALRTVISSAHDSVVVLDTDHKVIYFNDHAYRIMLRGGIEIKKGLDFDGLILKENSQIYHEAFQKALRGEITVAETVNNDDHGTRWLQHKLAPVCDSDGKVQAIVLSTHNLEKIRKLEKAFTHSENRFRKIFNSVAHPVILVSSDARISLCNAATSRVFGYLVDELAGTHVQQLLPDCPLEIPHEAAMNSPLIKKAISCKGHHQDGTTIDLELELSTFQDEHECFLLISAEDVTLRLANQRALNKFNHELTLLNYLNDSILNIGDEEQLLQAVCDGIVNRGQYQLAWISLGTEVIGPDNIIPINYSAGQSGYTEGLNLRINASPLGPTARSILEGKTSVTNNFTMTPYFQPWLERAQKFGINSSVAIPIQLQGDKRGVINIYSGHTDAFDAHEVLILQRIADNLSQAILNRRTEKEKFKAQYELKERIKELRTLYDVNNILHHETYSVHEGLHRIVKILPTGWQHPSVCTARIIYEGVEHLSVGYLPPVDMQKAEFVTQDNKKGIIEVGYTEKCKAESEGPFLAEERNLINTLAEMIGVHINERAAHMELRKSEANLKSVFDSTDVGHLLLDKDLRVIAFNKSMQKGYAKGTGIILQLNEKMVEQILPERKNIAAQRFQTVLQTGEPLEFETEYLHQGSKHSFTVSIFPVRGSKQDLIGYCMSAADITKRKQLEEERERIIGDLFHRNKDLEQFAFILSHNVRAPLANILGLTKLFSFGLNTEDKEKALDGIAISANRLDEVLNDVNNILQEKRTTTERKVLVELSEFTKEIISGLRSDIQKSGAHIEYDFPQDTSLLTIKTSLQSIFINIISNAIKFAKPGEFPVVNIRSEYIGNQIAIHFRDSGIGLDMNQFGDQIFGLYKKFNLHVEGKGLGLFLTKTHVNMLGGQIVVNSKVNEGMLLTILLPR